MKALHNVEASAFRKGAYVGYAKGAVYRITRRAGGGWMAARMVEGRDAGAGFLYGRTLAAISEKLAGGAS